MRKTVCAIFLFFLSTASANADETYRPGLMPASTYSIVGHDLATRQLGIAVQSYYFAVGSEVAFAEAGVGAIATQAWVEPRYGTEGLQLMRDGMSASDALRKILSSDEGADFRQVGFVDANGNAASHTGSRAVGEACKVSGPGFAAQANIMWKPGVCDAMAEAFQTTDGDLAARLMSALHAAEKAGGDIRGKQSAAIKVVGGDRNAIPLEQTIYDVRVDEDADPINELDRQLGIARAYRFLKLGDDRWSADDLDGALNYYFKARELLPDSYEMNFWLGVLYVAAGDVDESLQYFELAFAMRPVLMEVIPRLVASGSLPDDDEIVEKILSIAADN